MVPRSQMSKQKKREEDGNRPKRIRSGAGNWDEDSEMSDPDIVSKWAYNYYNKSPDGDEEFEDEEGDEEFDGEEEVHGYETDELKEVEDGQADDTGFISITIFITNKGLLLLFFLKIRLASTSQLCTYSARRSSLSTRC